MVTSPELSVLSRTAATTAATAIPRPARRWKTRVLLPAVIFLTTTALLAYSARNAFLPATPVWVAPVIPLAQTPDSTPSVEQALPSPSLLVQAPGWIEPDPYPLNIPALADGVIEEVLVFEGDRVEKGQVIARMLDDDAQLALAAARAQLEVLKAAATKAQVEVEVSTLKLAELQDQLDRTRRIEATGGGALAERVQLELRVKSQEQAVLGAQAAVEMAAAEVRKQEVACQGAELTLARMQIVSPASGVVMARLMEPGSRISVSGSAGPAESHSTSGSVLRLYDPARLQVRVEVPLSDFAKLGLGFQAQIATEALSNRTFNGKVTRIVHEANVQRNTVQVKVSITDPDPILKPEMLARVRFYGPSTRLKEDSEPAPARDSGGMRVLVPEGALVSRTAGSAHLWVVGRTPQGAAIASERDIRFAPTHTSGYVEAFSGVNPGDRVVVEPPASLHEGARVRILGEKKSEKGAAP